MSNDSYTITGSQIDTYSFVATLHALKLEMKGLRIKRNYSAYKTIKETFNLKGSRQKVHDQFVLIVEDAKKGIFPEGYIMRGTKNAQ